MTAMEIRLTIRQTPGRPVMAALLMLGLLVAAALATVVVSAYKRVQPIELGPPFDLPEIGVIVSPPRDWSGGRLDEAEPGLLAMFYQPDEATLRPIRRLHISHIRTAAPASPAEIIAGMVRGEPGRATMDIARIGPLPARQLIIRTLIRDRIDRQIVRLAVLAPGRYLLMQLFCLGPPTPYELRLMDVIGESVRLDGRVYLPGEDIEAGAGLRFSPPPVDWLVLLARPASGNIVLVPAASADRQSFWGTVTASRQTVGPHLDLGELLRAVSRSRTGNPIGMRVPMTAMLKMLSVQRPSEDIIWPDTDATEKSDAGDGIVRRRPVQMDTGQGQVEQGTAGQVGYWRLRQEVNGVVRLRYLFRPGDGDPPGGAASPYAVLLDAWCAAGDESAASAAIDRLIESIRLQ